MKHTQLRKHIIRLSQLANTDTPMISAFFNLKGERTKAMNDFDLWLKASSQKLEGEQADQLAQAGESVLRFLRAAEGASASCHVRLGDHPFESFQAYHAEMETSYHVESYPVIYPLVELKDKFKRFVLVTTTLDKASIIEISLGSASVQAIAEREDPPRKYGKEWTREHYRSGLHERRKIFIKEKVEVLKQICHQRSHDAIILAGEPRIVNRLKEALPKHLQKLVVDEIKTGISDARYRIVLSQAVQSYLKAEHEESLTSVSELYHLHNTSGLAAVGVTQIYEALQEGRAEKLIVASELPSKIRELLVKQAIQQDLLIETVTGSSILDDIGGAGAILRYKKTPEMINHYAA
ncbi:Protein required for attachment to host cells [Rubritalea squalenifaciens DSM 18772]|uniref:Protein required for attachment to host cells n=1 Tax=Rubritalea squalenifaciens DSM 18772 TaxID=1123071 RepID=A0A1M6SBE9_9BACT|nr:host attachment protein [Rubritalea squalenifaciens]SHK42074.1 Protein required for attachment to host cells [Rubritalea squalenifaciens DSM 18772]